MDRKLVKNFFVYLVRTFIVTLGSILVFPYASRVLGVTSIGEVQYVQSIASYFQLFATFGITSYGIREGSRVKDDSVKLEQLISELFWLNLLTTLISFTIYSIAIMTCAFVSYRELLLLFSLYIIFCGLNFDWIFNVNEEYGYITIRSLFGFILSIIVLVMFVQDPNDTVEYGLVIIIPYFVTFISNIYYIIKRYGIRFVKFRQILQHVVPISLLFSVIVSSSIYSTLDTTMLGMMQSAYSVGLYSAASKLARLISQLIVTMFTVFTPRVSYYIGKSDTAKFSTLVNNAIKLALFLCVPAVVAFFCYSSEGIVLFSGHEFVSANGAAKILSINLFFSVIDGFFGWQILVPLRKEKYLTLATFIGAVANFAFNYFLIPLFGVTGAAAATIISEFSVFIILSYYVNKYISLGSSYIGIWKNIVASLTIPLVYFIIYKLKLSIILMLCIAIPSSIILYVAALILMKDVSVLNAIDRVIYYTKLKLAKRD